ncbi:hypothetical protein [uncultured Dysosmobacter sp.]|uniref:hypothetical protein n=1 Tax=uncultured Dysosmobacter sp. TaxID=2591384 RepID=UPI0026256398|nr:hypothetical protein [uncultured Dysosmobacter sp.]
MRLRKILCMLMACATVTICVSVSAGAAEAESAETAVIAVRASGSFNMDIPAETLVSANSTFPLEAGETVTINAVYSPASAKVDFGLIGPDGAFYYVTAFDGNAKESFRVDERGNYKLAFRNNSSRTVSVSGYVNY